jgi:hypothetical protein
MLCRVINSKRILCYALPTHQPDVLIQRHERYYRERGIMPDITHTCNGREYISVEWHEQEVVRTQKEAEVRYAVRLANADQKHLTELARTQREAYIRGVKDGFGSSLQGFNSEYWGDKRTHDEVVSDLITQLETINNQPNTTS